MQVLWEREEGFRLLFFTLFTFHRNHPPKLLQGNPRASLLKNYFPEENYQRALIC